MDRIGDYIGVVLCRLEYESARVCGMVVGSKEIELGSFV